MDIHAELRISEQFRPYALSAPAIVKQISRARNVSGGSSALGVAVVGCGYWGSKHLRVLSNLPSVARLVAVEHDESLRRKIKATFPAVDCAASLEEALPLIDAAVIATPPESHFDLCTKALLNGKHVLVEKPLATTVESAKALVELAQDKQLTLMVGHTFQYNPAVRELKRRIDQGELGKIYYVHSARLNLGLYRRDVNVVWDLAPHDITIMNYLFCSKPTRVTAWGASLACPDTEDLAHIRLDYESLGTSGYIHLSWLDPNKVRRVTVVGTKKMAIYDDLAEERLRIFDRGIDHRAGASLPYELPTSYRYGDICSPFIQGAEPLALEDSHFLDCIQNDRPPETAGEDGLIVAAVLAAVDRSMRTGTPVEVEYPTWAAKDTRLFAGQVHAA